MMNATNGCTCGGNNSMRATIGRTVCDCGGTLTNGQIIQRIISRLNELDGEAEEMREALIEDGMDKCQACGKWGRKRWNEYHLCFCAECLVKNVGHAGDDDGEEFNEEELDRVRRSIVRYMADRAITPRVIPAWYKEIYRKMAR